MHIAEFGNPVLRKPARILTGSEIQSGGIKALIGEMYSYLSDKKFGVGLAAVQVSESVAVAVVDIHKTEARPHVTEFRLTMINPCILETYGRRMQLWEGCISSGIDGHGMFAKVPRYKKIKLEYYDEYAQQHVGIFEGLPAHVIQHEVDHLNGVLFVDRVRDTTTYMTYAEYVKMQK